MNKILFLLIWGFLLALPALSAQTYTVNTTLDQDDGLCDGVHCSLREAIRAANADGAASTIRFNLAGTAPFVIQLATSLPELTEAGLMIDGTTQPNFSPGVIVLDGSLLTGVDQSGLILRGNNITIYGLAVRGFSGNGILIGAVQNILIGSSENNRRNILTQNTGNGILAEAGSSQITIEGNYIGADANGLAAQPNGSGIYLNGAAGSISNVLIQNNLISGNTQMGIRATHSSRITFLNNFVGVSASGLSPIPNGVNGINLTDCTEIQIGRPGTGNLISGNREDGILIARNDLSLPVENIRIQGNLIGTDRTGTRPIGNGSAGIQCYQIEGGLAIGGLNPEEGNIIGGNNRGVWLNNCQNIPITGNFIGVGLSNDINIGNRIAGIALLNAQHILIGGENGAANTIAYNREGVWVGPNSRYCRITQNSFFCNLLSGIFITEGSNNDVGAPAFICAFPNEITGISPPRARVEVFRNDESCEDLACQGRIYIGATQADERGVWSLPGAYELGVVYTATATDVNDNTSTFLECVPARVRPQATATNSGPYCESSTIELFGSANLAGATFSWTGPNNFTSNRKNPDNAAEAGLYILTIEQGGCPSAPDSTLVEFTDNVMVEIGDDPSEWLCPGESIQINGTIYNEQNRTGTEQVTGTGGACDTIYQINLQFLPPSVLRIDSTLCAGENLRINGEIFDEARPSGTTILPGRGQNGCDSLITVELSFYEPAISQIDTTLCRGSSFIFNGEIYDENRPTGQVVVPGASVAGCDSLINIQVNFFPPAALDIDTLICRDDQLVVNGQVYDWNNPTGTEILRGAAARGCDSLINVQLRFYEPAVSRIDTVLCRGESFTYNGILYDENRSTGEERIPGGSVNGCDSLVVINAQFVDPPEISLDTSICQGQFLIINGNRYDETNPTGIELLPGRAGQCDTTLRVNLTITTEVIHVLNETLCEGERLLVNGRYYDASNPTGVERIPGGSAMGCDSVIEVSLHFVGPSSFRLEETLCTGEFIEVNGVRYDEANPTGVDTILGGAANGCDSIITVSLTFADLQARLTVEPPGCLPDAQGALIIEEIAGEMGPFSYSLDGKTEQPVSGLPFSIGNLPPGSYAGTITDANGCNISFTEMIPSPAALSVDLGPDLRLQSGDSIRLTPTTSALPQHIEWKPVEGLSCNDCLSPMARPLRTITYTLTIRNAEGCEATDDIRIEVFEPLGYYLPNAFSPNEDGENDVLLLYADPGKVDQINAFQIYDRWGNLLFERRNVAPGEESGGWDGRVRNGSLAPTGSYIFVLELQKTGGEVQMESGVVHLVR